VINAVLAIGSGLFEGSKYKIHAPFTIGRHPDNHLLLTDENVSRTHAVIEEKNGKYQLRDLKSTNGTWLNGKKIKAAVLREGDEIRIGRVSMSFVLESPTVEEESLLQDPSSKALVLSETDFHVQFQTPAEPELDWLATPEAEPSGQSVKDHLSRFQTLFKTNMLLSSQMELEGIFRQLLEQMFETLPADRGVIFMVESPTRRLVIKHLMTKDGGNTAEGILVSHKIVKEVFREGYGLMIRDAQADERFGLSDSIVQQDIRSALCAPIVYQGEALGMIYLDALGTAAAFKEADLHMLTAMAAPVAIQIRNVQYMDQVARSYLDTMEVLANAIEARDHYTVGHTWRVTRMALALAGHLGWRADQKRHAEMGGILHDIGKIAVEDSILRKEGPLTKEEYQKMQLHPEHGARIIKDVEFLKPVIPYILFHQERWDGKGYPFKLKGEDIPAEGRLLAIPDAFDAMTSHRPYRKSRSPDDAVREIVENRDKQFDPQFVDLFFEVWNQGEIASIIQHSAQSKTSIPCPFCSTHINIGLRPKEGVIMECPVCMKQCLIVQKEGRWRGELA
jgi:HD-GYP domain-containing protein (c-di-GMP phosphodiesterase class II)